MSNFSSLVRRADALRRIETDPVRESWWAGYLRGLRRAHHGDNFGTDAEHQLYIDAADASDPLRAALGRGYRAGLQLTAGEPD